MVPRNLFLAFIVHWCCVLSFAHAMGPRPPTEKPWMMGVLGDSIAAGTLADVPIPFAPTPEQQVRDWYDSGIEPQLIYTNKRALSWGSGEKIRSHFKLLQEWLARSVSGPLEVANFAHPGDESAHLQGQVKRLLSLLEEGRHQGLLYAAISIGSNDACSFDHPSRVDIRQLRRNFIEALSALAKGARRWGAGREPLRVLLVGVPRIPNLGDPSISNARTLFGLSCSMVRDRILRFCTPLTMWQGREEYLQRLAVVEQVNAVIRSVAIEASAEISGLEVFYSDRLYQLEIPLGALAADCFHPGRWAQQEISLQTWRDQPWFH